MSVRDSRNFKPDTFRALARELRQGQTSAEELLWSVLRGRGFLGLKFRRQHRVYNYIVDFYCHELRLILEVDGEVHESKEQAARDENRDAHLMDAGYRVERFANNQVFQDLEGVLKRIEAIFILEEKARNTLSDLQASSPSGPPSPPGRGG